MKFKKLLSLGMATILSASMLVGCSSGNSEESKDDKKIKVGMVTDVGGVNDQSFNQSAWEGLELAKKELGVEITYLESKQDSDYATNIETFVDQEVDLIIGVGQKLTSAIDEAAKTYPEQKFAIVDEVIEADNVESILFRAEQSAYLVGYIAGKVTETNKVGYIAGMEIPALDAFKYGYMAGVNAANPDAEILYQNANSFTDQAKGKAIAQQMYSKGGDIIFIAGGDVGTGAIETAKELGKYAIGVDRDQSDLAPENVLSSAIKKVDVGVYETVKRLKEGKFAGGTCTTYGLDENAVGIPDTTSNTVSKEILDEVNEIIAKFQSGELSAPKNEAEYKALKNK